MAPDVKFKFNETKGIEALTFIATQWPNVTAFFAAKILFFAEKEHLNKYARPIVADTFIAMPNGPVPSTIYDFIKGNFQQAGDPEAITAALTIKNNNSLTAKRQPNLDYLSETDVECLTHAIAFCRPKNFGYLSDLTHQERAWLEAPSNGPMDYLKMLDVNNPDYQAILKEVEEFAHYGVL